MKISTLKIICIAILILIAIRLFSFTFIPDRLFDYAEGIALAGVIFLSIVNYKNQLNNKLFFKKEINALILLTFFSSVPALLYHGQSIPISFLASRTILFWLLYYLLHYLEIDAGRLERLILIFGIIWAVLEVIQQFTFPVVWFTFSYAYDIDKIMYDAETRGGVFRIFIQGSVFGYFLIFYFWRKIIDSFTYQSMVIFLLALAAIFFLGSRQLVFTLILIFLIDFGSSYRLASVKSNKYVISIIVLILLISPFLSNYISALINISKEQQVTSSDYIRILEINYYLIEYWPSRICYLFGNGWEHSLSGYGNEMINYVEGTLKYFRSDIGLIGALNKFGIFFVLIAFMIFFKIIIPSKKIKIPRHIRLFYIFCLLTSFSSVNYFEFIESIILFTCVFYFIDKYNAANLNSHSDLQPITDNTNGA